MIEILKCYRPDGEVRALWSDERAPMLRSLGFVPRRASRVEVIQDGPSAGNFHVDFSVLAELTGDDRYRLCLLQTFDTYSEAVRQEVAWLKKNWLLTYDAVE